MADLLIRNAAHVVKMDDQRRELRDRDVHIAGGVIAAVEPRPLQWIQNGADTMSPREALEIATRGGVVAR